MNTAASSVEARLAALEARVRELSDVNEIIELISYVSPAADSGHADEFAARWASDGAYRVGERSFLGAENVRRVVAEGRHLDYMAAGCAHLMTPPHIRVAGDTAIAVNYTMLAIRDADSGLWTARRVSANRWQLRREEGRWVVDDRTIDVLDGGPHARELLAEAL